MGHTLKAQLTLPPVLAHFSTSGDTLVTCDSSATAIGAVLSKTQSGVERPIAFTSRALDLTEQWYSVGEREALACVWACGRWHLYLYGRCYVLCVFVVVVLLLFFPPSLVTSPIRYLALRFL